MHYLSPVSLLGTAFQTPLDPRLIQRERKKLLAELELNGDETLTLNDTSFTKNQLLEYFAELEQERIIKYHLAISQDPVLLQFLETATIEPAAAQAATAQPAAPQTITEQAAGTQSTTQPAAPQTTATFKESPIYSDPNFIEWLSPYFHSAFIKFATACFNHPDAAAMRTILDNKLLMTPADTERTWHFITNILEKNMALFDHYRTRGQKKSPKPMPITTVAAFLGHDYTQVIKQLPNSRFAALKDRYALNMQHPAIATFNRDPRHRPISVIWVENALDLTVSPSAIEAVQEKLDEFNRLLKKKRRRTIVRIVYAIFLVIGMSTSFFQTNDDPPDPVYTSLKSGLPLNQKPPDTVILQNDSTVVPVIHTTKQAASGDYITRSAAHPR